MTFHRQATGSLQNKINAASCSSSFGRLIFGVVLRPFLCSAQLPLTKKLPFPFSTPPPFTPKPCDLLFPFVLCFEVIQDVDDSSLEGQYQSFASLMEQRLAELFVLAGQQGTRFRRAAAVGSYTVQVRDWLHGPRGVPRLALSGLQSKKKKGKKKRAH